MGPLEVRRLRYKTDKVIDEILMLTCHGFLLLNYPIIISFVEKPPSLDDLDFQKEKIIRNKDHTRSG